MEACLFPFHIFNDLWSLTQVCPISYFKQESRAEKQLKALGSWQRSFSNRCRLQGAFSPGWAGPEWLREAGWWGGAPHELMKLSGAKWGQIQHVIQVHTQMPRSSAGEQ